MPLKLFFIIIFTLPLNVFAVQSEAEKPGNPTWYIQTKNNDIKINLYFFWSKKCPHCREALPFVEKLGKKHQWLKIYSNELTEHPEHIEQYISMAAQLGQEARSVPAFLWCANMIVGFDNSNNIGKLLEQGLTSCYQSIKNNQTPIKQKTDQLFDTPVIVIPILGTLSIKDYSLPAYTIILAALDAFNPCAFFVLLFLLSLLVHAKNRNRMLIVGGVFVLFSGLMYFLFMTAWLNVFLLMGSINAITMVAGLLAITFALINIKDYFWFKKGISLSIPESAKPSLYQRTRKLVSTGKLTTMISATIGLATFANLYEFLCTAGFPMVFTRILTLEELPTLTYYLYLLLYNIVYIIPLLIIVIAFSMAFGVKKLQQEQGKQLKLLSGFMMLLLGMVLVFVPNLLNNVLAAFGLLILSLLLSGLTIYIDHRLRRQKT